MSLINKFSVTYNLEQKKRRRGSNSTRTYIEKKAHRTDILSHDVAEALIKLGFDIEILMMLLKIHPYSTVDEALNLLSRDPDTHKLNHHYYQPKPKLNSLCAICQGKPDEHIDYDIIGKVPLPSNINDEKKILNTSSNVGNVTNTSKLMTTNNYDLSQTPLMCDNPTSSILNSRSPAVSVLNKSHSNSNFEYGKIEIPKETLELFDDPNICRICFSEKVNPNNISQISCGHFFCDSCIKTHITTKIINGKVLSIRCLMGGCPKKYSDEEIKANVTPEVFSKYKKFKNEQTKLNNPNKKYVNCPYPNCEELVEVVNSEEEFVRCMNGHDFCYKCHQLGFHKKGKCQKENLILLQQIKKGNDKNGINYKQCPKCKVIIEKNEGCNQMHCINCGFNFCWLCLKKYTNDHYAMYNVRGCPGMRFETDSGIKWMRNPCLKILWYFFSCLLGFLAVLLVLLFYLVFGCAYEFINCYTKPKSDDDDDEYSGGEDYDIERQRRNSYSNNDSNQQKEQKKNWPVLIFIGFLGFCCQPLYLMFYILYGLMECYRRFNCWFYYVDY